MERLTTGDFIGSLHFDPVLVEIMAGFVGARLIKFALSFRTAMRKPIFGGVLFGALPLSDLAGSPEIDDFSHAWSRRNRMYSSDPRWDVPSLPTTPTL
jgi:hypothetical protein